MKLDLLIKNGRVIDTGASIDKKMDLGVKNGRFADITQLDEPLEAERVLEAEGYIVTPGLIDSHVHVFDKGCDLGIPADLVTLPYGGRRRRELWNIKLPQLPGDDGMFAAALQNAIKCKSVRAFYFPVSGDHLTGTVGPGTDVPCL